MILPLIYLTLFHGSRHKKIPPRLPERDYFGSRSWRVSRKIKAMIGWLLRTDTVFLQLIFPLQEVVTTRTTLLTLRGWHLGIAFRFKSVWKGKNRTELKLIGLNQFSVRFGSKTIFFGLVVYFGSKPDWTENVQPYTLPKLCMEKLGSFARKPAKTHSLLSYIVFTINFAQTLPSFLRHITHISPPKNNTHTPSKTKKPRTL
jgi:hypothetical protein